MWASVLEGPGQISIATAPAPTEADLIEGQVLLRFRAGAICGSDLPKFLGVKDPLVSTSQAPGHPLHEIVGDVVASRSRRLKVGDRVVGFATASCGLAEYVVNNDVSLSIVPSGFSDHEAVVIQPLATVLAATSRLPVVRDKRVAVIGLGSIGLLFSHALHDAGAAEVIGVDRVDRSDVASAFGLSSVVRAHSSVWARELTDETRPSVIVEAVGHQPSTLNDAIEAVEPDGHVFAFGVPDDDVYAVNFKRFFRKRATLGAGNISDWQRFLDEASIYLGKHSTLSASYITHRFEPSEIQQAYELAVNPLASRIKIVVGG